jgi:hypothetical protein
LLGSFVKLIDSDEGSPALDAKCRGACSPLLAKDSLRLPHCGERFRIASFYPLLIPCDTVIAAP